MINKDELLFVVDNNDQPVDPLPRHLVHKKKLWHRTSGIWVINKKKQILCQKRSMLKDINPGKWEAFFGGHLLVNDNYFANAATELAEELGIFIQKDNLIPYKVFSSDKPGHREFQRSFIYKINKKAHEFHLEEEEIDQVKWFDFTEVKKILVTDPDPDWVHKPWDTEMLEWIEKLI